jgi:PTH1 family peptidyl-tRNA hydrolase
MNDKRSDLHLIAGLGNPGRKYAGTRHNLGFEALEELGRRHGIAPTRRRFRGMLGEGAIAGRRVLLLRPGTYMNLSGESVAPALRFYQLPLAHLLVICDDVYLPPGKVRLRRSGSAGGHKGLISIIQHLDSDSFPRLRIGVGEPPPGLDQVQYVLMPFGRQERLAVQEAVDLAADVVEAWLAEGIEAAMNRFN